MRITDETGVRATGSDYTSDGTAWHEVLDVGQTAVFHLMVKERQADPLPPPGGKPLPTLRFTRTRTNACQPSAAAIGVAR